jgi:hypothetical protein
LKFASYIINTTLILLFSLQVALIVNVHYRGFWSVPTWLVDMMFVFHAENELKLDIEKIRYYPKKGVELTGIRVQSDKCICPVVRIGSIKLLYRDGDGVQEDAFYGVVNGGTLFYPDSVLPEAENEKLVENVSFGLSILEDSIKIYGFNAAISNLDILTTNPIVIPRDYLETLEEEDEAPENISERTRKVVDRVKALSWIKSYFDRIEEATLTFNAQYVSEALGFVGRMNLYSLGSRPDEDLVTSGLNIFGSFTVGDSFKLEDEFFGKVGLVRYKDSFDLKDLSFELRYDEHEALTLIPNEIYFSAESARFNKKYASNLSGLLEPSGLRSGKVQIVASVLEQSLLAGIDYNLETQSLDLKIEGAFDPLSVARAGWLDREVPLDKIEMGSFVEIELNTSIEDGKMPKEVHYTLVSDSVNLMGVNFGYGRAEGLASETLLTVSDFCVSESGHYLRGEILMAPKTTEYRYVLRGGGFPDRLNPMFKPWWTELWQDFEFSEQKFACDLDVWGTDSDERARYLYGKFEFGGVAYKGLPIERGHTRIHSVAKFVDLFDMDIDHARGKAAGRVQNVFHYKEDPLISQHFDFWTNIPLHDVTPVLEEVLAEFRDNTNPEAWADVYLKGCAINEDYPEYAVHDGLDVHIQVWEPVEFFGFIVDWADVRVRKIWDRVVVQPAYFRFAEGYGNGTFVVTGDKPDFHMGFELSIEDMDYRVAMTKVIPPDDKPPPDPSIENPWGEPVKSPIQPSDKSYMDLVLAGSIPVGKPELLEAHGRFVLDDPLIHRVHMFGGFSKMMDNAELNLGSFSLKHAESTVRVEGFDVFLDDLLMTGPSSRVKSRGRFNTETGALDFRLKAYPLREVKFPVIAGLAMVMHPFTQLFEVKLQGTVDEPTWDIVIAPGGL